MRWHRFRKHQDQQLERLAPSPLGREKIVATMKQRMATLNVDVVNWRASAATVSHRPPLRQKPRRLLPEHQGRSKGWFQREGEAASSLLVVLLPSERAEDPPTAPEERMTLSACELTYSMHLIL